MSKQETSPKLGRGLEALIPKSFFSSGKSIINIPIREITPNPFQPRLHFNEEAISHLAHSIQTHGLAQPIVVRRVEQGYEIVAGERRFRACKLAGLSAISAIVREMSDYDSLKIALVENLDREDLNAVEEAKGYKRLIEEFEMTHKDIAEMFNKSRSKITNTLRVLKLPLSIQRKIETGLISEGHARSLLSLDSELDMLKYADQITDQNLNVRDIEDVVKKKKNKRSQPVNQLALFKELESKLSDVYAAKFKIQGDDKKGQIQIKYTSEAQFNAITAALSAIS